MCTVMLEDWYAEGERAVTEVREDKHRICCWKEWNKSYEWTGITEMLKNTAEQVRHNMKIDTANLGQDACSNQDSFNTTTLSPISHDQQRNVIKQFLNYPGDYRKTFNEHDNRKRMKHEEHLQFKGKTLSNVLELRNSMISSPMLCIFFFYF